MRLLLSALLLTLAPVTNVDAQSQPASSSVVIHGRVLDAMQAPVVGASVAASDGVATPVVVATDQTGNFEFSLPPGRYTFTASATGFTASSRDFTVANGATSVPPFVLQVAGIEEHVQVGGTAGYEVPLISSATKTPTPLRDVPQSVTVVTSALIQDQMMMSIGDVMRYVPGVAVHQGENNRDQVIIRGNSSS